MAKTLFLFLLLFTGMSTCSGQDPVTSLKKINELLVQIKVGEPDTLQIMRLWEVGKYYLYKRGTYKTDLDSALYYFGNALKLSDNLKVRRVSFQSETRSRIGETYFQLGDFKLGKAYFEQNIKIYHDAGDKPREARTWLRLAVKCKIGDFRYPEIPFFLNKSLALYREIGDKKKEADVLFEMGVYNLIYHQTDSAEVKLLQSLKISEDIKYNFRSLTYYYLAMVYRNKGNTNKSLFYVMESMNNAKARKDTAQHGIYSNCYALLALVYHDLGDGEKSISMYKAAIHKSFHNAIESESLDNYLVVNSLVLELTKYNRVNEAVAIARQIIKESPPTYDLEQGSVAEILGNCYNALKDYDRAEKYFLKMAGFYQSSDFYESRANKVLGRFYLERQRYALARSFLSKQFNKVPSSAFEFSGIIEDEYLYYKIDSAERKYLAAMAHYRKYKFLNDSVFDIHKSREIEELQLQYQTDQKEARIKLLTKDGEIQRENVVRANNVRNLTVAGIVVLTLFISLLYYNYRVKQRSNKALNLMVREKDTLLEQKEWLLKEIHHRVKNNLQIAMGLLQQQAGYISNKEALAAIRNSENRMHSIALIHQKLYQTTHMNMIAMSEYVDELISYLKDSYDLGNKIYFEKQVALIELEVSQAVPVGLILCEAITNAIKYAYPNKATGVIQSSLTQTSGDSYLLVVQDHGRGLPKDFNEKTIDSMGLNLIKGLSKQLGGTFTLKNDSGVAISILFKATRQH